MKFIRKHKVVSSVLLVFLLLFSVVTIVFGRYIKNILNNFILETKRFYFNSSVLSVNGKNYSITNWDGVNSYTLTVDLNNRKNDERYTKTDIEYDIDVNCPNTVICTLSKEDSIIHPEDVSDSYIITMTPIQNFYEGDTVLISTSVTSSVPYVKTMSASYTIGVEKSDFSYDIEDSPGSKFLTINFINSISYYEVSQAFGTHAVGEHISLDEYSTLSASDQDKCFSAIITLEYNPSLLLVDMTNPLYINHLSTDFLEQTINGFQYVSKFSFKVNASSSSSIIFYKDDPSQNYTYPIVNSTSIIGVSVNSAN